jgi:hypothetical protein
MEDMAAAASAAVTVTVTEEVSASVSCDVCRAAAPRYKCPRCAARYCCVGCCRTHKEACSAQAQTQAPEPAPAAPADTSPEGAGGSAASQRFDDADRLLTDQHKAKLNENSDLRDVLRSKRLRDVLDAIDSAPDRQKALRKARLDPAFEAFVGTATALQGRAVSGR